MSVEKESSEAKEKNLPIVERGNLNDLEQIVHCNYEIFKGMYENEPYSFEVYKERLANKEPIIFFSKKDDKIIGDSISFKENDSLYIWILGVDSKHREQGIGNLLLEKNEQFAKDNNFKSVSIKVYNVSEKMQHLLKKRGYKILEIKKSEIDPKYNAVRFELII